jgi:hypothetical protein
MAKPKATMSFKQSRKALLDKMTSKAKGKTEEKVIHFRNKDVPNFLHALDVFEKKSRKSVLIVK